MGKLNPEARRLGLSGTMISQRPLDAYGVWRAVESPNLVTWGPTYTAFRNRYAIQGNPRIPQQVTGWRNLDEFGTKVALTTFHRRSEDVLDLPEIMHDRIEVEMNAQEARVYREIEREFCAVFEDGTVTPANVLVQLLRLLEICGGAVHHDGNKDATVLSERPSKAAALAEILEDLAEDEPVVVFCKYRADIDAILRECEKLGRSASELSGRRNQLADWQAGKTSVLAANTASGGVGVDLTRAAYGVFYSSGHSLAEYLQAVARLHRPGQERTTHFYSLVSTINGNDTVDGQVYEALAAKKEVLDAIIGSYNGTQKSLGAA
jgi:SNF2 family DNA or RNA helicase